MERANDQGPRAMHRDGDERRLLGCGAGEHRKVIKYRIKQGGVVVAGSNSAPDILHYAYLYVEDDTVHVEVKDGKRWKSFCTIRKEQADG